MGAMMTAAEPSNRELASERANQLFASARRTVPARTQIAIATACSGSVHRSRRRRAGRLYCAHGAASKASTDADRFAHGSIGSPPTPASMRFASRKNMRRLLPDQHAPAAAAVQMPRGAPPTELAWLEPYPDSNLGRGSLTTRRARRRVIRPARSVQLSLLSPSSNK